LAAASLSVPLPAIVRLPALPAPIGLARVTLLPFGLSVRPAEPNLTDFDEMSVVPLSAAFQRNVLPLNVSGPVPKASIELE